MTPRQKPFTSSYVNGILRPKEAPSVVKYDKGSRYILTADVNVWSKPSTSSVRKGGLKEGTVLSAVGVSEDSSGNIWLDTYQGYVPVYYNGVKRANYYGKAEKPSYNSGSKYILTAYVNVWNKPSTSSGIKKVKDLTADGKKNASSSKPSDNAVLKPDTVVTALGVSEDSAGNIWLEIPSGYIPVYYKGIKRANWYNK